MSNQFKSKIVVLFKRFERFWHWAQAIIIILLLFTGLEMHGFFRLFGFAKAVNLHNYTGFIWTVLVVLIYTWILTTNEWQQYFPSSKTFKDFKGIYKTIRFYLYGVFVGEDHPHHMTLDDKFNPLQRLGYIGILFGLVPLQLITGLLYFFFPELRAAGIISHVEVIAMLHTISSYALLSFIVIHIYMTTFGKKLTTHIKAMITGKEKVDDHSENK
jgi:thiosulfate reductase cytochrome b subunit